MTEKQGGSDVDNGTDTISVPSKEKDVFELYGYKWFTSAIDSQMALTLARDVDKDFNTVKGTNGLSLYYIKIWNEEGSLNGIDVIWLKDKLGTRQLPTAELVLNGTKAIQIGEKGKGIKTIGFMLNITWLHNAYNSVGAMWRIIALAWDWSERWQAFGKKLNDH